MGRSVVSVRQGVNHIAERWARTARRLPSGKKRYGGELAAEAKTRSSEAFCGCETPLEAALFSALTGAAQQAAVEIARTDTGNADVDT